MDLVGIVVYSVPPLIWYWHAVQAEQRQQRFKSTPVGRAAYKADHEARAQPNRGTRPDTTAQDWLT